MSNPRLAALAALLVLATALPAAATDVERRITFAPGASGTVIKGRVDPRAVKRVGEVRDRYVLRAAKGQTLSVTLKADKPALLYVWREDYNAGPVMDGTGVKIEKTVKLKAGGDYTFDVEVFNAPAISYTLTVSIL